MVKFNVTHCHLFWTNDFDLKLFAYKLQADIYSLGITIYELITGGIHPFNTKSFQVKASTAYFWPV